MDAQKIIPCALCAHPQRVDVENLYSVISEATKIPIDELRSTHYEFICHDCSETDTYRDDYYLCKGKPHAVLGKRLAIINN